MAIAPHVAEIYADKGLPFPPTPNLNLTTLPPPLNVRPDGNRFNLRNNYHDADAQDAPLQFIYEAANCRLYYERADIFSQAHLWSRVVNVTWGTAKCVSGSTVNSDDSMPKGAYDTVGFSSDAMSKVSLPPYIGLVSATNGTATNGTTISPNGTYNPGAPSSTDPSTISSNSASGLSAVSIPLISLLSLFGIAFALL